MGASTNTVVSLVTGDPIVKFVKSFTATGRGRSSRKESMFAAQLAVMRLVNRAARPLVAGAEGPPLPWARKFDPQ